jgi:hypothetical protein
METSISPARFVFSRLLTDSRILQAGRGYPDHDDFYECSPGVIRLLSRYDLLSSAMLIDVNEVVRRYTDYLTNILS